MTGRAAPDRPLDLRLSKLALGGNNFGTRAGARLDLDETRAVAHAALDVGVTLFDTSDIYAFGESEELLGAVLSPLRDEVTIATKFGVMLSEDTSAWPEYGSCGRPEYVRTSIEGSLRRLRTDTIDLYQIHSFDRETPIEDTLGELGRLQEEGKVRYIGCSNAARSDLRSEVLQPDGSATYATVQNQYSLMHRLPEEGVLSDCTSLGIAFLAYSPLANGLLTGKYRGLEPPQGSRLARIESQRANRLTKRNLAVVARLEAFARARGHSLLELAIAWLVAQPRVTSIIAGATSPEQVRTNAAALAWELEPSELAEISELTTVPAPDDAPER